jgi:hypothetical protein
VYPEGEGRYGSDVEGTEYGGADEEAGEDEGEEDYVDTEVDEGVFIGGGAVIVKADSGRFQHAVQYCYWMYELNVLIFSGKLCCAVRSSC